MQLVIDSSLYNPFLACLHWLWAWAVTRGDWVTWSLAGPCWPAAMCWPSISSLGQPPGVAGMLQFVDTFYISSDTWHDIMTPWHCVSLTLDPVCSASGPALLGSDSLCQSRSQEPPEVTRPEPETTSQSSGQQCQILHFILHSLLAFHDNQSQWWAA